MILYITDRNIRVDNADNQISYNSDYIAEFHFDDEWNGKIKTARFVQSGEYFDVVLVDDRCEIPPLKTGFVRIGVFTDSMTSTYADVYYKTSIKDGTGNPAEPPEDVYAQLTALIESGMLKGADGLTPYVGSNNNWWIGDIDTGILARGYTPRKGVDYFTDGEIKQIQNEVSESIQANINHLEINKADKSELDKTNLSLDALWKMNRGQTYDVLEQESEAYSVDVPSGAKHVGIDKVGGKSVVFEQRIKPENIEASKTENGITFTNNGDGTVTVSGTASADVGLSIGGNITTGSLKNKPFILTGCPKGGSSNTYYMGVANTSDMFKWDKGDGYYEADGYGYGYKLYIYIMSGAVIDTPIIFKPNLFIINKSVFPSLDSFKQMFPADYYPYSEPTIISSQTDRVEVASADGTITQQITTGFPVLNSAGSAYDYIDLNEGKLHQRVGVVDLGTLKWVDNEGNFKTTSLQNIAKLPTSNTVTMNALCDRFVPKPWVDRTIDKAIYGYYASIEVKDSSYTDATAFKTAMSGVMLYYELAEEVITDITIPSELTDWLEVEAGGSVTFHNTDEGKRLLIPNKLSFVRKLDEVTV